jgi:hypothetical protein
MDKPIQDKRKKSLAHFNHRAKFDNIIKQDHAVVEAI